MATELESASWQQLLSEIGRRIGHYIDNNSEGGVTSQGESSLGLKTEINFYRGNKECIESTLIDTVILDERVTRNEKICERLSRIHRGFSVWSVKINGAGCRSMHGENFINACLSFR